MPPANLSYSGRSFVRKMGVRWRYSGGKVLGKQTTYICQMNSDSLSHEKGAPSQSEATVQVEYPRVTPVALGARWVVQTGEDLKGDDTSGDRDAYFPNAANR